GVWLRKATGTGRKGTTADSAEQESASEPGSGRASHASTSRGQRRHIFLGRHPRWPECDRLVSGRPSADAQRGPAWTRAPRESDARLRLVPLAEWERTP